MQNLRRNRIGCKNSELWSWAVEDIKKMTGPLAVQEYIQELISKDCTKQETTPQILIVSLKNHCQLIRTYGNTNM
jgi:hypothetical protein